MKKLYWNKDMSVGLEELDNDHQGLISIINRLADGAERGAAREELHRCLMALLRYTQFHFAREEAVMAACGVKELPEHKEEHIAFAEKIKKITDSFDDLSQDSALQVNQELLNYLTSWLRHHIMVIDMAYRPLVENQAEAHQAAQNFQASHLWLHS